uniref:Peptidase S1 domain-containing protein n=3 Tax=Sphaeramia orbicularis TaxID=375764 RepID=A0A672YV67_9TELE
MHGLHKLLFFCVLICVEENALGSEIIHGQTVPDDLMLYMASVQNDKGIHLCGGFLISEDFVVTAAHCDPKGKPISVVLGTHDLNKVNETMRYQVEKCKHPSYKDVGSGNDIMLLKLSTKAKLGHRVQPVQLPKTEMKVKDKAKCRVAGWGRTSTNSKTSPVLRVAGVSIINHKTCQKEWATVRRPPLPKNIICAGGYGTDKGFCRGDSGGPLVHGGVAVGVVSFNMGYNCDYPNVPNVYTDVSKFLPWIKKSLKKRSC